MKVRVRKAVGNLVMIDASFLYDERLSLAAKGLLAFLVSRPHGDSVRSDTKSPDKPSAVKAALDELEACGYIRDGVASDNCGLTPTSEPDRPEPEPKQEQEPERESRPPPKEPGWGSKMMAAWYKAYGGAVTGWTLKFVKPFIVRDGTDVVLEAFARYAKDYPDARYASLRRFAEIYGRYHTPVKPASERYTKLSDERFSDTPA